VVSTRLAKINSRCRRRICASISFSVLNLRWNSRLVRTRFTRDQVPVSLKLYLKWQLEEPLKLATHGYETPYDALRDKTQSILTQIVAHRKRSLPQAR
jgi:regulator of protease activity HflC (stomatin/prohibitin superfamily)